MDSNAQDTSIVDFPALTTDPGSTDQGTSGPNLVDSILHSIQSASGAPNIGMDSMGMDVPMSLPTTSRGQLDMPPFLPVSSFPLSEFGRARQAMLNEHIPRVERLARNIIAGMYVKLHLSLTP